MDRRQFLKSGSLVTLGTASGTLLPCASAWAYARSAALAKFVAPLRRFGRDIPFAVPDGTGYGGATHYTIAMEEITDLVHPALGNDGTRLWSYTNGSARRHLGAGIVARRAEPVQVTFVNKLPGRHLLPVDVTLPGAELRPNRASVHLHGGHVPWTSDGGPHAWWAPSSETDPARKRGESFVDMGPALGRGASPDGHAEFYYPNAQSARMMWFHDHALGTTRLNAYAGLAAPYVITDDVEAALSVQYGLPGPVDQRTLYLTFQDKVFVSNDTERIDPAWFRLRPDSRPGDLWYPHEYDSAFWSLAKGAAVPPSPSVVPEMFGDTILVNGTACPFVQLEQREYRLRMLNACNARFLNPRLLYAATSAPTQANHHAPGPGFVQVSNEGGFLPAPVQLNQPGAVPLLLAPAERADLVVDLRNVPAGAVLVLYNDAPAPFPMGDARFDVYPGNPRTPWARAGFGPDTRTLLQLRVTARTGPSDPPVTLPAQFDRWTAGPVLAPQLAGLPAPVPRGARLRRLTLSEGFDEYGRLTQFLGTDQPADASGRTPAFGRRYEDPPTEIIAAGTTEVWEIANLTADTHPIHFHLVNVQLLSRQRFSAALYPRGHNAAFEGFGNLRYLGKPQPPDANELGWKETVRMNPGEVTRVLMRFDLPHVGFAVPSTPRLRGGGHEYVWHCHILEHEEHDMMRPLIVR